MTARAAAAPSGQARLTAWLRARAARDRIVALEEALLAGRLWRLAARRLSVFLFARGWATALHVIELGFLTEIFLARPFVASLAVQNAALIVDAFWWGALEVLRRRLRIIGVRTDAQVLTTRYLTVAMLAGLAGCAATLAWIGWRWRAGNAPTLLDAYALVCVVRLGLDLALRALYSGVYAYGRVHRPAWSAPVGPTVLVGTTVALWPWLAGWSFVAALAVSVLVSRALLLRFTLRAYRVAHVPLPAWRARRWRPRTDWRLLGQGALAGTANLTTRLASLVLLGAVIPSLASGEADMLLLAYVLHLAAPLILVTCQWSFVFYHDWKRLEADVAAVLARRLHRGLLAVALVIATVAWTVTALLVLRFVRWQWAPVGGVLTALGPTYLGLSLWTALQLRGFARGEFASQAVSAGVVVGAILAAGTAVVDPRAWYWTLAGCPWLALAAHLLLARWLRPPRARPPASLDGWVHLLARERRPLVAWCARIAGDRPAVLVDELRRALADGRQGNAVAWRGWVFWYEIGPGAGRAAWLVRGAGLLAKAQSIEIARGADGANHLVRAGWLAPPLAAGDTDGAALARAHARLFPGGFDLRVGQRPPAAFAALPAEVRQAIWREAIRRVSGARRRSSPLLAAWRVTALAPGGQLTRVFVAPRADGAADDAARAWSNDLQQSTWRVPSSPLHPVPSPRPRGEG